MLRNILPTIIYSVPNIFLILAPFWGNWKVPGKKFWLILAAFLIFYVAFESTADSYFYSKLFSFDANVHDEDFYFPFDDIDTENEDFDWDAFFDGYFDEKYDNTNPYLQRYLVSLYSSIYFVLIFLFCWLIVKMPLSKIVYVTLFVMAYFRVMSGISMYFPSLLLDDFPFFHSLEDFFYSIHLYSFTYIFNLILSAPLVLFFLIKCVRKNVLESNSPAFKNMWVIPLVFIFIVFFSFEIYLFDIVDRQLHLFVLVLTFSGLFIINNVVIKMVNQTENIALFKHQLDLQSEHYKALQSHIENTKKARHDLRHHLSVIKSLINTEEKEKLSEYVNEYEKSLPDDTEKIFCDNFTVNSLLIHYITIAKNEGVRVSARLELPEVSGVSNTDLCIIFGNCLENAIEACRNVDEGKFIKINCGMIGKIFTLTIDNSFSNEIKKVGDIFLSTKHDGQGIGISSVKGVVQKYDGNAQFEVEGNVFQASVMLRVR